MRFFLFFSSHHSGDVCSHAGVETPPSFLLAYEYQRLPHPSVLVYPISGLGQNTRKDASQDVWSRGKEGSGEDLVLVSVI